MKPKGITTLCISFIMFFSVFFINIDNSKAMGTPDGKGYAECWYNWSLNTATTVSKTKHFLMAISVFRDTNGNYNGYAVTGCTETNLVANNIDNYKCNLTNYDSVFNEITSNTLGQKFRGDLTNNGTGKWSCPTIYVKSSINSDDVQLSLTQKNGYTAVPTSSGTGVEDYCENEGQPTLKNDTTNNINPYSKYTEEGYKKNNEDPNNYTNILNWGEKAKEGEYSSEDAGTTCNSINEIGKLLNTILWVVDIIAIIILIIMTMADFIKAIVGSKPDDTLKASFKHLITRAIVVVILLLLPVILGSVISLANQETGIVQIGENGEPFCNVE